MGKIKCIKTSKVQTLATNRAGSVQAVQRDRGRPWMRLRQQVLKRDGYLCQHCAKSGKVEMAREVDHINPLHRGGGDNLENLQALCIPCHQAKTAGEERERQGR